MHALSFNFEHQKSYNNHKYQQMEQGTVKLKENKTWQFFTLHFKQYGNFINVVIMVIPCKKKLLCFSLPLSSSKQLFA